MPDGSPDVACCILHALLRHCSHSVFEFKASGEFDETRKAQVDTIRNIISIFQNKIQYPYQTFFICSSDLLVIMQYLTL